MREEIYYFAPQGGAPFSVQIAGISYCDGSYRITREKSDVHVLEYVVKGEGVVEVDKKSAEASAGDIYYLPAYSRHNYYSGKERPWVKIFMNFKGDLADRIAASYLLHSKTVYRGFGAELFKQILDTAKSEKSQAEKQNCLAILFHRLAQQMNESITSSGGIPREIQAVKELMDSRLSGRITMAELGSVAGKSQDYVNKYFKHYFGTSPYDYFLKRKIEIAKELLKSTTLSVKEIAFKLSFDDQHYFSGAFKKITGVPPSKYRRG